MRYKSIQRKGALWCSGERGGKGEMGTLESGKGRKNFVGKDRGMNNGKYEAAGSYVKRGKLIWYGRKRILGGMGRNGRDGRREGKIFGRMEGMGGKEGSLEVCGGMEGMEGFFKVWEGMEWMGGGKERSLEN